MMHQCRCERQEKQHSCNKTGYSPKRDLNRHSSIAVPAKTQLTSLFQDLLYVHPFCWRCGILADSHQVYRGSRATSEGDANASPQCEPCVTVSRQRIRPRPECVFLFLFFFPDGWTTRILLSVTPTSTSIPLPPPAPAPNSNNTHNLFVTPRPLVPKKERTSWFQDFCMHIHSAGQIIWPTRTHSPVVGV
jgi:hypothetical protein